MQRRKIPVTMTTLIWRTQKNISGVATVISRLLRINSATRSLIKEHHLVDQFCVISVRKRHFPQKKSGSAISINSIQGCSLTMIATFEKRVFSLLHAL